MCSQAAADGRERSRVLAGVVPFKFAAKVSHWACLAVVSRGRRKESADFSGRLRTVASLGRA